MSEIRTPYVVSGRPTGPDSATLHPFSSPLYRQPSWLDVRAVIDMLGLSGSEVGNLTGVSSRTVRKWTSPPESSNHVEIQYSPWHTLLVAARLVEPVILL